MQFSSKVMYYLLHKDIETGSFLIICITILNPYSIIIMFTSKDFIKLTINQFSIELYCGIVVYKLFNFSVSSFKISQTIHRRTHCMGLATQTQCQSIHEYTYIYFLRICFSMPHVFLGFNIDVIFCFAIKLPFLDTNNSLK